MKTLLVALTVLAAALTLTAPARAKDQWVIAFGEEPFTLNPAGKGAIAAVSDYVQIHIYDALIDFTGPTLALKPMLALRWENPNPTTWRFHLRRGVKFHNGDALTAEDVKFTVDTQLANKGSSINAYLGPTEGARVIDAHTVEITTKTPFPPLLFNLTRMHILPRGYEKLGADAFAARPIGSGPYRFVEWQRGQRIVLDVNPDYWGGQATPKRLVFRPIVDPSTRAAELKAGGVDIVSNPPIAQVKELSTGDTTILIVPGARVIAYPMNTLQKPLMLHPNEFFDGAVVRWNRGYVGSTYGEQNHPMLIELCRRHGHDLNFLGCIVFGGVTVSAADKEASSSSVSKMARLLRADAALVIGLNGSNHAVDLMLAIQKCERAGIKTTLVYNDVGEGPDDPGFIFAVPEADAIVNAGSRAQKVTLPKMATLIGGDHLVDPDIDARGELTVPMRYLYGAIDPNGASRLTVRFV